MKKEEVSKSSYESGGSNGLGCPKLYQLFQGFNFQALIRCYFIPSLDGNGFENLPVQSSESGLLSLNLGMMLDSSYLGIVDHCFQAPCAWLSSFLEPGVCCRVFLEHFFVKWKFYAMRKIKLLCSPS